MFTDHGIFDINIRFRLTKEKEKTQLIQHQIYTATFSICCLTRCLASGYKYTKDFIKINIFHSKET